VPPITELTRIEPVHLDRLAAQGVFTTGLLLEVSETPTRRQYLADQVDASPNDVLAWRDEGLMLNLAGFGSDEHQLMIQAGIEGLRDILALDGDAFRHRPTWRSPAGGSRRGRSRTSRARGTPAGAGRPAPNDPVRLRTRRALPRAICVGGARSERPRSGGGGAGTGYHARVSGRLPRVAASIVVAVATAIVILALAILPFLNPVWVSFEQGRSRADAWTGFSPSELRAATDAILADLVFGPPAFDVEIRGEPVLDVRERGHMADVRGVFLGFGLLALVSAGALAAAHRLGRGRAAFWRPVRAGAIGVAGIVVGLGLVGLFAFDAAFEAFHRLFFAGGNYTFDPATDRLVQLFPYQFWVETSFAVGAVTLVLAAVAASLAQRRLGTSPVRQAARQVPVEVGR
jgi:integral membrane protein (TIGR01906 family)